MARKLHAATIIDMVAAQVGFIFWNATSYITTIGLVVLLSGPPPVIRYGSVKMLNATVIASTITIMDVMGLAQRLNAQTYDTLAVFTVAGGLYLTMNGLLTIGFRWCERRALAFQA